MKVCGRVVVFVVVLGGWGCRAKKQPPPPLDISSTQPSPFAESNAFPDLEFRLPETGYSTWSMTPPNPNDESRKQGTHEFHRRQSIESVAVEAQLLLAIPLNTIDPIVTRPDGLLQRRVSLEILTVFVGEQPDAVVEAYEIVANQQEFMSRERKEQVVVLQACLEDDGEERLAMVEAHAPSANETHELAEAAKRYRPYRSYTNSCSRGTIAAAKKELADKEAARH